MHLVSPNFFLTMSSSADSFESAAPRKRPPYASYSRPLASDSCVRTTYFGVSGPDDPRVLALSYSIALSHRGVPIHALIDRRVYRIDVSIADNMYLYRGKLKYEGGMATFKYKYTGSYEFCLDSPKPIFTQIDEMSAQIALLSEQLSAQEDAFAAVLEAKADETRDLLALIHTRMQRAGGPEPRKTPRFGIARPTPPRTRAFAIEQTMEFERQTQETLPGFPIPAMDSPEPLGKRPNEHSRAQISSSVDRMAANANGKASLQFDCAQERARPSFERGDGRPGKAVQERQAPAAACPPNASGKSSIQFPPSLDRTRAAQPGRPPPNRETSFLVEDFSMDSKTLFGMLGLSNAG
jgi:hypothetical protein